MEGQLGSDARISRAVLDSTPVYAASKVASVSEVNFYGAVLAPSSIPNIKPGPARSVGRPNSTQVSFRMHSDGTISRFIHVSTNIRLSMYTSVPISVGNTPGLKDFRRGKRFLFKCCSRLLFYLLPHIGIPKCAFFALEKRSTEYPFSPSPRAAS